MRATEASLAGRVALVTGAGRGIGRAHALALAAEGAAVVVNDLGCGVAGEGADASVAREVVEVIEAGGGRAVADGSDVGSFVGAARAVDAATEAFGRIDIVVNNAGIVGGGDVETLTEETLDKLLAVHLKGSIGAARAAFPHMRRQRWGRIVNTVSEVALDERFASGLGYAAAKAAVWSATLAMARDGSPHGITVNAISPGARTRMSGEQIDRTPSSRALDLDPAHVARVVVFLASERAADVTGRILHAAGGHLREYRTGRSRNDELEARISAED